MMRLKMLCATALLVVPLSALAQSPGQSSNPAQAQFSAAMAQEIGKIDSQFLAAAEAMPEDKFNFTPESLNVPGSELKGVRTFAMQVKHVAADNFSIWAPLTGKPEPAGINAPAGPDAMKSRTEILKFLRDSMAYSREAVTGLTAENALQMVEFRGTKMTRLSLAVLALTHMNDHYGQIVEYLRLSGTVPPASR
ncbi:MAG TPA: DinB family protein [Verrucomicrobiae bacterium]|nr:DinB family protein [Verrucomicrobiae bacterium]